MSSSKSSSKGDWCSDFRGFTLVELLLGLALTLCLALAVGPLWTSIQSSLCEAADAVVLTDQGRVAIARLERDLLYASASGAAGLACTAIVKGVSTEIVLLTSSRHDAPELVEWEFTDGSLMRRRGPWTGAPPTPIAHSLYVDHKTMLEQVEDLSFTLLAADGGTLSYSQADLPRVARIRMDLTLASAGPYGRPVRLVQEMELGG